MRMIPSVVHQQRYRPSHSFLLNVIELNNLYWIGQVWNPMLRPLKMFDIYLWSVLNNFQYSIIAVIFSPKTISGVLRKLWQYFATYTVSYIHVGSCLKLWFFIKYAPYICYIYLGYNSFVFVLNLFVWWMDCYRWPSDVCITFCG
jgi:hypothetical protein